MQFIVHSVMAAGSTLLQTWHRHRTSLWLPFVVPILMRSRFPAVAVLVTSLLHLCSCVDDKVVNVTIDDTYGDAQTGKVPIYTGYPSSLAVWHPRILGDTD